MQDHYKDILLMICSGYNEGVYSNFAKILREDESRVKLSLLVAHSKDITTFKTDIEEYSLAYLKKILQADNKLDIKYYLFCAVMSDNVAVFEMLIEEQDSITWQNLIEVRDDLHGYNLMHYAMLYNRQGMVKLLLDKCPELMKHDTKSPVMYMHNFNEDLLALVEGQALIDAKDYNKDSNILHRVMYIEGDLSMFQRVVDKIRETELSDERQLLGKMMVHQDLLLGDTPLLCASRKFKDKVSIKDEDNYEQLIKYMIGVDMRSSLIGEFGTMLEKTDKNGSNFLHLMSTLRTKDTDDFSEEKFKIFQGVWNSLRSTKLLCHANHNGHSVYTNFLVSLGKHTLLGDGLEKVVSMISELPEEIFKDIDDDNRNILHLIVETGNSQFLEALLTHPSMTKEVLTHVDRNGQMAIHRAIIQYGNGGCRDKSLKHIIKLLLLSCQYDDEYVKVKEEAGSSSKRSDKSYDSLKQLYTAYCGKKTPKLFEQGDELLGGCNFVGNKSEFVEVEGLKIR